MTPTRVTIRAAAAALIALAASSGAALAQQPNDAQLKAARAVMEASGGVNTLRDIVPVFLDEAKRNLTRTRPELAGDIEASIVAITPEIERRRERLLDEIAVIYAQRFTAEELTQIKAFYETPAGAKLVKTLPELLQSTYQTMQVWTQRLSQDVVTLIRQDMRKRGKEF